MTQASARSGRPARPAAPRRLPAGRLLRHLPVVRLPWRLTVGGLPAGRLLRRLRLGAPVGLPGPRARAGRCAERGSATAELAVGLPAVVMLLLAGLAAVAGVTTKLECVDAAREAALAASRGQSGTEAGHRAGPDRAEVSVAVDGDLVHATVRAPVPLLGARLPGLAVSASAVAAVEPGSPDPAP